MRAGDAELTLFLGPQTRLGRAINDIVRENRAAMADAGLSAYPNRIATRTIRKGDGDWPATAATLNVPKASAVFLSATHLVGGPGSVLSKGRLLPETTPGLEAAADIASHVTRIALSVEPVHHFLWGLALESVFGRAAKAGWEELYELTWTDFVAETATAFPGTEILVLTPEAAVINAHAVLAELFGAAADGINPANLRLPHLSVTGGAVLKRLADEGRDDAENVESLLAAYPATPEPDELRAATGIDKLTAELLDTRFREDLTRIETIPNVRLI